jgi:hypothetical protein
MAPESLSFVTVNGSSKRWTSGNVAFSRHLPLRPRRSLRYSHLRPAAAPTAAPIAPLCAPVAAPTAAPLASSPLPPPPPPLPSPLPPLRPTAPLATPSAVYPGEWFRFCLTRATIRPILSYT